MLELKVNKLHEGLVGGVDGDWMEESFLVRVVKAQKLAVIEEDLPVWMSSLHITQVAALSIYGAKNDEQYLGDLKDGGLK